MSKARKRTLKFLILVAIAHVTVLVILPALVSTKAFTREIEEAMTEMLGRDVKLEGVSVNVLDGVVAKGFSVAQPKDFIHSHNPQQLQVESFELRANLFELAGAAFGRPIQIEKLEMDGAYLDIIIKKDGNNFSDVLKRLIKPSPKEERKKKTLDLNIQRIVFKDLELRYTNEVQGLKALTLTAAVVGGTLKTGQLVIDPNTVLKVNGGEVKILQAQFDATKPEQAYSVHLAGNDIKLDSSANAAADLAMPLLSSGFHEGLAVEMTGALAFGVEFGGRGYSLERAKTELNGKGWITVDKGELDLSELLRVFPKQLGLAAPFVAQSHDFKALPNLAEIGKIAFGHYEQNFNVHHGAVHIPGEMFLSGDDLSVALRGSTSFDREIDFTVRLKGAIIEKNMRKFAPLLEKGVIRLTGSLSSPRVEATDFLKGNEAFLKQVLEPFKDKLPPELRDTIDGKVLDEIKGLLGSEKED